MTFPTQINRFSKGSSNTVILSGVTRLWFLRPRQSEAFIDPLRIDLFALDALHVILQGFRE